MAGEQARQPIIPGTSDIELSTSAPRIESEPSLSVSADGIAWGRHLRNTFTRSRLIVFSIAACMSILGMCFIDMEKFAVDWNFPGVESPEACSLSCTSAFPRGICDRALFKVKYCDAADIRKRNQNCTRVPTSGFVKRTACIFPVKPRMWEPYFVITTLAIAVMLIIEGKAAEMCLMGACCIFAAAGIMSGKEAFAGLASSSVAGLFFLFPIAAAIEETGLLEDVISVVLGNPKSYLVALIRMMLPVALLSALLSNTAIVAMMIPIIISWGRRLDISPSKMLMPLSFAAQVGGSCTLIGSSHCLVAKDVTSGKGYEMGFFDLTPPGLSVALCTFIVIFVFSPLLRSSDAPAEATAPAPELDEMAKLSQGDMASQDYRIVLVVQASAACRGSLSEEICQQLARFPGVQTVAAGTAEGGGAPQLLSEADRLTCSCTAQGLVALRRIKDYRLGNNADLQKLGMSGRRRRQLYEVVLRPESSFVGSPLQPPQLLETLGCGLLGIRGKVDMDAIVRGGDVLLLEAEGKFAKSQTWSEHFSLVRTVPDSSPPRIGTDTDTLRGRAVCVGMVILVLFVTVSWVELSYGAGIFVLIIIWVRSRSMDQVYASIKAPVLLTIAGAFGVSSALQKAGVAGMVATCVTTVAAKGGAHGIRAATYFVAAGLSMFINNSATIAILGPMVTDMAEEANVSVASLVWILVIAAGACFTTPLGYQTNMMVMKDGGYSFGDFTVYGGPVQATHMVVTLVVIWILCDVLQLA